MLYLFTSCTNVCTLSATDSHGDDESISQREKFHCHGASSPPCRHSKISYILSMIRLSGYFSLSYGYTSSYVDKQCRCFVYKLVMVLQTPTASYDDRYDSQHKCVALGPLLAIALLSVLFMCIDHVPVCTGVRLERGSAI